MRVDNHDLRETYKEMLVYLCLLFPIMEKFNLVISEDSDDPVTRYCDNIYCKKCIFNDINCDLESRHGVKNMIELLEKKLGGTKCE